MGLREVTACGLLCVLDDIFEHAGHGGDIRCNPAVFKRRFGWERERAVLPVSLAPVKMVDSLGSPGSLAFTVLDASWKLLDFNQTDPACRFPP